jgi:hypothetical protein
VLGTSTSTPRCCGAGKTTFAKEFLRSIGVIRFLNDDEITRGLLVCSALESPASVFRLRYGSETPISEIGV